MIDRDQQTARPSTHCRRPSALFALAVSLSLFVASGANCNQWVRSYTQPRMLPETATLSQIVNVVNENTSRVVNLQSTYASLSIPHVLTPLRADVTLQSPLRMRLRASAPMLGPQFDLGSNDDLFWLWFAQNPQPATFVCRHDQFAISQARQFFPVEPQWLIEAVGLVRFDPSQPLEGPTRVGGSRVQITSREMSMLGELRKVTTIDEWDGTVVEQSLYTPQGQLLAIAKTSRFMRDPRSQAALPKSIDVEWPMQQLSFHLDVTEWQVNSFPPDNLAQFIKPDFPNAPDVNLADPNLRLFPPGAVPPGTLPPASMPPVGAPPATLPLTPATPQAPPMNYPAGATVVTPSAMRQYPPGAISAPR